jgi:hypothetical protein
MLAGDGCDAVEGHCACVVSAPYQRVGGGGGRRDVIGVNSAWAVRYHSILACAAVRGTWRAGSHSSLSYRLKSDTNDDHPRSHSRRRCRPLLYNARRRRYDGLILIHPATGHARGARKSAACFLVVSPFIRYARIAKNAFTKA